jgi:hypothetical protein
MIMASLPMPAWSQAPRWIPAPQPAPAAVETPARLSALEWSIVAMAERDSVSSLREPGRLISALRSIFGFRSINRLANDRLEVLRRIAVHAWRFRWNVPDSELQAFLAAGYSLDQYQLVQVSIANARASQRRRAR